MAAAELRAAAHGKVSPATLSDVSLGTRSAEHYAVPGTIIISTKCQQLSRHNSLAAYCFVWALFLFASVSHGRRDQLRIVAAS